MQWREKSKIVHPQETQEHMEWQQVYKHTKWLLKDEHGSSRNWKKMESLRFSHIFRYAKKLLQNPHKQKAQGEGKKKAH